ncbi:MAG: hypothetical protein WC942_09155 [Clostridia bacterium]|jgi:hypothetical protein
MIFFDLLKAYYGGRTEDKKNKNGKIEKGTDGKPKIKYIFNNYFLPENIREIYSNGRLDIPQSGARTPKIYTGKSGKGLYTDIQLKNIIENNSDNIEINGLLGIGGDKINGDRFNHNVDSGEYFLRHFSFVGGYLYNIIYITEFKNKKKIKYYRCIIFPEVQNIEKAVDDFFKTVEISGCRISIPEEGIVKVSGLLNNRVNNIFSTNYEYYVTKRMQGGFKIIKSGRVNIDYIFSDNNTIENYRKLIEIRDFELRSKLLSCLFHGNSFDEEMIRYYRNNSFIDLSKKSKDIERAINGSS